MYIQVYDNTLLTTISSCKKNVLVSELALKEQKSWHADLESARIKIFQTEIHDGEKNPQSKSYNPPPPPLTRPPH